MSLHDHESPGILLPLSQPNSNEVHEKGEPVRPNARMRSSFTAGSHARSRFSNPTVSEQVADLPDRGLILEAGEPESAARRGTKPALRLFHNAKKSCFA